MPDLKGKVCLVTGAGGEIGAAIADAFVQSGATVYLGDVAMGRTQAHANRIQKAGATAYAIGLDVSHEESWTASIGKIVESEGGLDVLVNCAGLFAGEAKSIEEMTSAEWRRIHAVNLDGAFLGVRAGVRAMRDRGGAIVNIGSVVGYFGARSGVAYGVSKSAIRGLTVQSAASCLAAGIPVRINAVHPGYVLTDAALGSLLRRHATREEAEAEFATRSPANRVIRPADVANVVAFFASDKARAINGAELLVDDGLATQMPGRAFA